MDYDFNIFSFRYFDNSINHKIALFKINFWCFNYQFVYDLYSKANKIVWPILVKIHYVPGSTPTYPDLYIVDFSNLIDWLHSSGKSDFFPDLGDEFSRSVMIFLAL